MMKKTFVVTAVTGALMLGLTGVRRGRKGTTKGVCRFGIL